MDVSGLPSSISQIPETVTDNDINAAARKRRENMVAKWALENNEIVVIPSGLEVNQPGDDLTYPFIPHAEHFYLAGRGEPQRVLVYDPTEGWTLFTHVSSDLEMVWLGKTPDSKDVQAETAIERVLDLKELGLWLSKRRGAKVALLGNDDILRNPAGYDLEKATPSPYMLQEAFGVLQSNHLADRLRMDLNVFRSRKDLVELSLIKNAADITRDVFHALMMMPMVGRTEAQIRAFIESQIALRGMRPAYPTIALVGERAAVLHGFNPTNRVAGENDMLLVDAAASYGGYMSDVTRTMPTGQGFTHLQRDLYKAVLDTQVRAIEEARAGEEIRALHARVVSRLAENLVHMGILNGPAGDRVEDGSCETIFPHGTSHMLGIKTHDMGRYCDPGRSPDKEKPGGRRCSVDFTLEPGQVFTIEPGAYLLRPLLTRADIREKFARAMNWSMLDRVLEDGSAGFGVRIEDDIMVTPGGGTPLVFTSDIPKTVHSIEELRRAVK